MSRWEEWSAATFVPSTIPSAGNIYELFNMPVQEDSLTIEVYDETGNTSYGSNFTLNRPDNSSCFETRLFKVRLTVCG